MIHIVSGFMRSGTSMMMKCLEAGGLEALYNPKRDEHNTKWADNDYHPNQGGYYELMGSEYKDPEFPDRCEGKLVKALRSGPIKMIKWDSKHKFTVVVMRRDSEEIRQSAQAIFSRDVPSNYGLKANHRIDNVVSRLRKQPCWSVSEMDYRWLVDNPLEAFENMGWPIDPVAAASIVNPDLCRFKLEELDVGV